MKSFPFKDFHKSRLKLAVAFFSQSVLNQFPMVLLPLEKQDREECFETSRGQTLKHKISLKLEYKQYKKGSFHTDIFNRLNFPPFSRNRSYDV